MCIQRPYDLVSSRPEKIEQGVCRWERSGFADMYEGRELPGDCWGIEDDEDIIGKGGICGAGGGAAVGVADVIGGTSIGSAMREKKRREGNRRSEKKKLEEREELLFTCLQEKIGSVTSVEERRR